MGGGLAKHHDIPDHEFENQVREFLKHNPNRAQMLIEIAKKVQKEDKHKGSHGHSKADSRRRASIDGHHLVENMVHQEFDRDVNDVYCTTDSQALGTGLSGTVVRVTHRTTGVEYAMKSLKLTKKKSDIKELRNETTIMSQLDHPNIVRLIEAFYTETHVHLIMELCSGGELFDHLLEHKKYTEEEAKGLVKKMLYALRYLHEHNIVHRDLKLENILFDSMDRDAELKICDFGLSQHYHHGEHMHSTLGTPYYIAPEVLRGDYDEKCDLWSVGVICFMLLSGTPPFPGHNNKEIMEAVKRGEYAFDPARWKHVRQPAMDFISALLKMDPDERPSCSEALTLDWLTEAKVTVEEQLEEDPVLDDVVNNLCAFREFSALKRLALEVVAFSLEPTQIKALRHEFEKFDTDHSGEITVKEFREVLSLSAHMKPSDVDKIFQKIDLDHTGKIHWHEFLAASVNRNMIDEAHLKQAFEHLDHEHKGVITRDDVQEIMGEDALTSEISGMFEELGRDELDYEAFVNMCRSTTMERGALAVKAKGIRKSKIDTDGAAAAAQKFEADQGAEES